MTESPIASQAGHWYERQTGAPMYEVACTSKDGTRPTTIRDARKLDLVPSVTLVLNCMAKPALEAWKARQLLEASMTLPKRDGESLDDYAKRVVEDSKAQGIAAADRGTQLHAAIEKYIAGYTDPQWGQHLVKLDLVLAQHGIDIHAGKPEHSFSAGVGGLYYGGKVDYHTRGECVVCDFKSKEKIENDKRLAWDEHLLQLSAYAYGLFSLISSSKALKLTPYRALNVFVGVSDCEVRVVEHTSADLEHAFSMFQDILSYWSKKNRFGPYAERRHLS